MERDGHVLGTALRRTMRRNSAKALLETTAHPPHRANPVSVHHELRRSPKRQHPRQRPALTGPAHLW